MSFYQKLSLTILGLIAFMVLEHFTQIMAGINMVIVLALIGVVFTAVAIQPSFISANIDTSDFLLILSMIIAGMILGKAFPQDIFVGSCAAISVALSIYAIEELSYYEIGAVVGVGRLSIVSFLGVIALTVFG